MVEQHHTMVSKLGEINTLKRSIEDILNSNEYQEVWKDMWHDNKSHMCVTICGKHKNLEQTQFWDQWEEYTELDKDKQ